MRARASVLILGVLAIVFAVAAHPQDQTAPPDAKPAASDSKTPGTKPAPLKLGADVMTAKLIQHVPPVYPLIAKTAHIEETVVLHVVVAKDGTVQDVGFVSRAANPAEIGDGCRKAMDLPTYAVEWRSGGR